MFADFTSVWPLYLICLVALVIAGFWIYRSGMVNSGDDPSGMVGQQGVAQETFAQEGVVMVRGELWRATSDGGIVQKGDTVQVREIRAGLILVVHRVER